MSYSALMGCSTICVLAQASCIKFLSTFRNQLDTSMLVSSIPVLCRFLSAKSVVVHTYAAVALEKLVMVCMWVAAETFVLAYTPKHERAHPCNTPTTCC